MREILPARWVVLFLVVLLDLTLAVLVIAQRVRVDGGIERIRCVIPLRFARIVGCVPAAGIVFAEAHR
jgi:hypothetical protein